MIFYNISHNEITKTHASRVSGFGRTSGQYYSPSSESDDGRLINPAERRERESCC